MSEAVEAARQRALLNAVLYPPGARPASAAHGAAPPDADLRLAEPGAARTVRGLAVYRANGHALAERALAAACPTLAAMVGTADFAPLARAHWHAHPPERGDIAEWGPALPGWLAEQASLAEWPWLPDMARLELALQHCEHAADAAFDAASFALLADHAPERLQLLLMPGTALVASAHPIVTMLAAHRDPEVTDADDDAGNTPRPGRYAAVRAAWAAGRVETALVWRRAWRAEVCAVDARTAGWMAELLAGTDLATALSRHADPVAAADGEPVLDFGLWLQQALSRGWLKGVQLQGD